MTEDVKDGIYLSGKHTGGFRLGVVVCNSAKNLLVTKEAEPLLKSLYRKMKLGRDVMGDIDKYYDAKGEPVFSWFGENRRVLNLNNLDGLEQARGSQFREDAYMLID